LAVSPSEDNNYSEFTKNLFSYTTYTLYVHRTGNYWFKFLHFR